MTGQAQVSWILWLTWSSKVELPLSKAVPAVYRLTVVGAALDFISFI